MFNWMSMDSRKKSTICPSYATASLVSLTGVELGVLSWTFGAVGVLVVLAWAIKQGWCSVS
jgi:hypothetical protein